MDNLLKSLINDEKKNAGKLYSAGPYWDYKNLKTINQIKKKGISKFRGYNSGVGTSFTDNLVVDIRNELNFKTCVCFLKKRTFVSICLHHVHCKTKLVHRIA